MVGIRTYAHALTPLLWEALNVQFQLMCLRLHLGIECRKAADKRRVLATLKNRRSTNGLKCCRDVAGSLFPLRSRELLIDAMAGGKTVFSPVVDLKYGTTIWHAVAEKICSGLVPDICPASPQDKGAARLLPFIASVFALLRTGYSAGGAGGSKAIVYVHHGYAACAGGEHAKQG